LDGAMKLFLGIRPVPVVPSVGGGQGVVCAREIVIQLKGLCGRGLSTSEGFLVWYDAVGACNQIGVGKAGIGRRKFWVALDGLVEVHNRLSPSFAGVLIEEIASLQVRAIGLRIYDSRLIERPDDDVDAPGDVGGDFVLQPQNLAGASFVGLSPEMGVG